MLAIKDDDERFESLEEFIDNVIRGGEIEFEFMGKEELRLGLDK